ncbi:unnamed protein product [Closterium sp. NIES-54]
MWGPGQGHLRREAGASEGVCLLISSCILVESYCLRPFSHWPLSLIPSSPLFSSYLSPPQHSPPHLSPPHLSPPHLSPPHLPPPQHARPYRTCFTRGGGRTAAVGDLGGAEIFVLFVCADEQGRGLTEERSADGEEVRRKLRVLFADWPAYLDVIEVIPPDLFLERRVLDVPPLPRWRNGRILVIGDAAHAVPPTLGQGSSLAIEDALELARQVVSDHPSLECVVKCCFVPLLVTCLLSAGSVQ